MSNLTEKILETPIEFTDDVRDALNSKLATSVSTAGMTGISADGQASIAMLCMFDLADGTQAQVVLSYDQMTELCEVIIRCIELAPIPENKDEKS